jgi:hypothetical protein
MSNPKPLIEKMSAEEKKWQAQANAMTLMEAEGIKSDPAKLKAAAAEARRIADEAEKVASQRKAQASKIQPSKPTPKSAAKPQAKPPAGKRGK